MECVHKSGLERHFCKGSGTSGKWEMIETLRRVARYVFVYLDRRCAQRRIAAIPKSSVLHHGDGQGDLTGRDLEFADWIWRQDGRIGAMKALQIGDWIEITDGAFKALKGTIVKMDRRRKTFLVSLDGAGAVRQIWLTYEVVEKRDALR